jgi:hypothetical protein
MWYLQPPIKSTRSDRGHDSEFSLYKSGVHTRTSVESGSLSYMLSICVFIFDERMKCIYNFCFPWVGTLKVSTFSKGRRTATTRQVMTDIILVLKLAVCRPCSSSFTSSWTPSRTSISVLQIDSSSRKDDRNRSGVYVPSRILQK